MKIKSKWENIRDDLIRIKVFGGWIVSIEDSNNDSPRETYLFVPDKNHEWELEK